MSQFQPLPGVTYRIQNVQSEKYLEFDPKDGAVVRPRHDDALEQQWKFFRTAKNTYKVVNAASDPDNSHLALSMDTNFVGLVVAEDEDETSVSWRVNISPDRSYCSFTAQNQQPPGLQDHLEMVNDNLVQTAAASSQANQKWRIVLGLPTGFSRQTYHLHNTDAAAALTVRENGLTMAPVETGPDQAWELIQTSKGGDYEIKKVGGDKYLSWTRVSDGVYKASLSSQPSRWAILNYEQYNYGIFPNISGGNFALTGKSNVPLEALSQDHRGQTWLIQTYAPSTPETHHQPTQTLSPPRRVSVVPDGNYMIGNVGSGFNAYAQSSDRGAPVVAIASPAPVPFLFTYMSPTSPFFLMGPFGAGISVMPGEAGSPIRLYTGGSSDGLWYLVEEPGKAEYYICTDVAGKRLAWGKSIKSGLSVYHEVFTLVEWVNGDPSQRWVLTRKD